MTPATVVYLGPSLDHAAAASALRTPAVLLPPVRRGDLERLGSDITRVAIIDGMFFAEQAVSPREVLQILARGVQVLGSSSMGALRASELAPFGMRGVGMVYQQFASGELDSDAEVALVLNPETGHALTEPRVNVRAMIRLAHNHGLLNEQQARGLIDLALRTHYVDLTYKYLIAASRAILSPVHRERFAIFVTAHRNEADIKRSDALELLRVLDESAREKS